MLSEGNDLVKLFAYFKSIFLYPGDWINVPEEYFRDKALLLENNLPINRCSLHQKIILIEEFLTEARRNQIIQNELPRIFGIETYCPYYEKVVIELLMQSPFSIIPRNGLTYDKVILKKLAEKRGVPNEIINRAKKGLSYDLGGYTPKSIILKLWLEMINDPFLNKYINVGQIHRKYGNNFFVFDMLRSLYWWHKFVIENKD